MHSGWHVKGGLNKSISGSTKLYDYDLTETDPGTPDGGTIQTSKGLYGKRDIIKDIPQNNYRKM